MISNQLLAEKFMNGDDLFTGNGANGVDQWTLDQTSGAATALQKHWVRTRFAADLPHCRKPYSQTQNAKRRLLVAVPNVLTL